MYNRNNFSDRDSIEFKRNKDIEKIINSLIYNAHLIDDGQTHWRLDINDKKLQSNKELCQYLTEAQKNLIEITTEIIKMKALLKADEKVL
jgi:hypothetical protein